MLGLLNLRFFRNREGQRMRNKLGFYTCLSVHPSGNIRGGGYIESHYIAIRKRLKCEP